MTHLHPSSRIQRTHAKQGLVMLTLRTCRSRSHRAAGAVSPAGTGASWISSPGAGPPGGPLPARTRWSVDDQASGAETEGGPAMDSNTIRQPPLDGRSFLIGTSRQERAMFTNSRRTMRRLIRICAAGISASMLIVGLCVLPAGSASASVKNTSYRLSAKSCTELRELTIELERQNHVRSRPVDCIVRVRTVAQPAYGGTLARVGRVNAAAAAAATGCQGFWRSYSLTYWLSGTVNVGLCSNGSSTWSVWGPDCGVSIWPIYAWEFITNKTWCGVYNNRGTFVQPGENFTLNPYLTPWWPLYICWVRFLAGPSGSSVGMNYGAGGC